jgi:predicted transcriptional regulator
MENDLTKLREELKASKGKLKSVANETGINYKHVHRIMNGEGDPGYSKVQALCEYFRKRKAR